MYKGQLEGFPTEIVEKMLERQIEQSNKKDVTIFENKIVADYRIDKGFNWDVTVEGQEFWDNVIHKKKFDIFFNKYPKQIELPKCFGIFQNEKNPLWKQYIDWLNEKYKNTLHGSIKDYYGIRSYNILAINPSIERFGKDAVELTLEQWYDLFIKPTIKTDKMEKEIIGYIAPFDMISLSIKKGDILRTYKTDKDIVNKEYAYKKDIVYGVLPIEIVETWEPAYKLEKVIYLMGIDGINTFELTVQDGVCYHKTEDITNYVKEVQRTYKGMIQNKTFGNYVFNVKDMIISKTGCENKETLLSQWLAIKL